VREIVAGAIIAAPAHGVKLPVCEEIDANHAHPATWHIRTRLPALIANYRWGVFFYGWRTGLPLAQCKWDTTDGEKWKQEERASEKMRFNRRLNVLFHNLDLRAEPRS
jgi:hypothetical protein